MGGLKTNKAVVRVWVYTQISKIRLEGVVCLWKKGGDENHLILVRQCQEARNDCACRFLATMWLGYEKWRELRK